MLETVIISSFDKFMSGALGERIQREMENVAQNILDINTVPDKARTINITLTIKPDKSRTSATVTSAVTSKLAPAEPLSTAVNVGITADGELVIVEMKNVLEGQKSLFDESEEPPANVAVLPTKQQAN